MAEGTRPESNLLCSLNTSFTAGTTRAKGFGYPHSELPAIGFYVPVNLLLRKDAGEDALSFRSRVERRSDEPTNHGDSMQTMQRVLATLATSAGRMAGPSSLRRANHD